MAEETDAATTHREENKEDINNSNSNNNQDPNHDDNDGGFRIYLGDDRKNLECRYYEAKYPDIESVVMVTVRNIADMGAYVTLMEYGNIEGMILLSELSRRRIRSIHKLIRVGRNEVVMVLRVDKEKGYIDLSKRRVSPEDVAACEDRFNKAKAVHGVLRHVAEKRKYYLEELYEKIGWPLYRKYGNAFDAFKLAINNNTNSNTIEDGNHHENNTAAAAANTLVDPFDDLDVPDDLKEEIKTYIVRRLAPQPIKIRSDIEVSCFTYEGIDAIRSALLAGMAVAQTTRTTTESENERDNSESKSSDAMIVPMASSSSIHHAHTIKIKLIAPPIYVVSTTTLDKDEGIDLLNHAIDTIRQHIVEAGGKLDVKMPPKAISIKEENELQAMLERVARENEEVDGDAPDDE